MPNTTPHKATLRRYDGEKWNPVYLATSADIVQIGEGLTVMGPNHGIYTDGELIPANEPVSTIIKKLIQTRVPPTYLVPKIKLSVTSGNKPGVYEVGDHINVTLESIVAPNDAGEIQAHNITNGENSLVDSTTPSLSHVIDMDLTEDVVLRSACAYEQGDIKQDNFNEDYPEGVIPAGTITSEPVLYKIFRKTFFGADKTGVTTPLGTSDAIRALPNTMEQFTKDDVLVAELDRGSTRFTIAYPASSGYLRRVEYVEAGNANVLAQFKRTSLAVEGANHAIEDLYHVYTLAWDQPISGNMTLRAYCGSDTEPTPPPSRTHEIVVDTGNGTSLKIPIGITSDDKVIRPEDPIRNNYTFGGWYKDPECTIPWDFENDAFTNDTIIYIKWIPNFAISIGGDTSGIDVDFVIDPDGKLVKPEDPVRDHYIFRGWHKDSECTILWDFENDKVTSDVTIYPKWEKITHQVTFNSNSGSAVATQTIDDGATVNRPSDPTRTGYTFGGWYTDAGCTTVYDFSRPVVSGFTLYAKWTQNRYMVTFNTMNGTFTTDSNYTINSTTITHGGTIAKPSDPTYEGHTFNGWFTDSNFSNQYNFNNPVSQNLTLYAKWTQITYTVTFNTGSGSSVASQTVAHKNIATKPTDPTCTGYTFGGWYTNSNYTTAYNFSTQVTGNITLYAKWNRIYYTVSFNSDGGSAVSNQSIAHGSAVSAPTAPTKDGYTFGGWYIDSGKTTAYNFSTAVTNNITLYAKWTIIVLTVTFNSQGGTAVASAKVNWGSKVSAPTAPTREGYTFNRWCTSSAGTTAYDFNSAVKSNITLYATWTQINYTITFNSNGGTSVANQTVAHGNTATKPTNPTRTGHSFVSWYTDANCTAEYNFSTAVKKNTTLYAKWTTNSYLVTFNVQGGTFTPNGTYSTNTKRVNYGTKISEPAAPTRAKYRFLGWYTSSSLLYRYDFNKTINADTTLYAKWDIVGGTATFSGRTWKVVHNADDTVILKTTGSIGTRAWASSSTDNWSGCSLRDYLNTTFYNTISATDKNKIISAALSTNIRSKSTSFTPTESTTDKIWLESGLNVSWNHPLLPIDSCDITVNGKDIGVFDMYQEDDRQPGSISDPAIGTEYWLREPFSTSGSVCTVPKTASENDAMYYKLSAKYNEQHAIYPCIAMSKTNYLNLP